jgi:hypothetical protein
MLYIKIIVGDWGGKWLTMTCNKQSVGWSTYIQAKGSESGGTIALQRPIKCLMLRRLCYREMAKDLAQYCYAQRTEPRPDINSVVRNKGLLILFCCFGDNEPYITRAGQPWTDGKRSETNEVEGPTMQPSERFVQVSIEGSSGRRQPSWTTGQGSR